MRKILCVSTPLTVAAQKSPEQAIPFGVRAVTLLLNYTNGDEATVDITLEFTPQKNLGWYSCSGIAASGVSVPTPGTIQLSASALLAIPISFQAPGFFRISFSAPGAGAGAGNLSAYLAVGR